MARNGGKVIPFKKTNAPKPIDPRASLTKSDWRRQMIVLCREIARHYEKLLSLFWINEKVLRETIEAARVLPSSHPKKAEIDSLIGCYEELVAYWKEKFPDAKGKIEKGDQTPAEMILSIHMASRLVEQSFIFTSLIVAHMNDDQGKKG